MVNYDSSTCDNVGCLRSSAFWDYEREMVALYLDRIHPDCLWVDDDVRLGNHGVIRYGCFCPNCLKEFSKKTGKVWTREKLAEELFLREEPSSVRMAWAEFNQESIALFIKVISEKAADIQPGIRVGIQCAEISNLYNGFNFGPTLKAIQEATHCAPCIRLGGWTYTDKDCCRN